jgi:hypothetical protein
MLFVTAYAERSIFAADAATLLEDKDALMDESRYSREWAAADRQPLFGLPRRPNEGMRTAPQPDGCDFGAALKAHAETFGRYRWETKPQADPQ